MRRLQGRHDALALGQEVKRCDGLVVTNVGIGNPRIFLPQCVLGANRGVVETRRYRMRALDLTVIILEENGARTVEDAGSAGLREPCGVVTRGDAAAPGLDSDQPYRRIGHESRENPGDPPPTQATTRSGIPRAAFLICTTASRPMTVWKSRTIIG